MKPRDTWEGQLESTTLSFDVVEEATASNATPGPITTEPTLINVYDRADKIDYIVAASCGVLTGLLDAFWIGEFSLKNAQTWGRDKTNKFVIRVAQMRGYKKDELEGAIRFLEKAAPMASDQLTSVWGGGLQHHFRDFAHHASIIGLIFSLMTQFTGMSYGTNTEGLFEIHELHDKSLIGRTFEEKLYNGIIMWMLHLISDMAGSSSSAGKGTGIPGPLLSLAKELSVLPGIRNLKVDYKDDNIGLSVLLSKIFNGTAFEHTSYKDITRFDLRTEMGIYAYNVKQNIPVIINQCAIRAFYFVRRLCIEISNCNIRRLSDLKRLNPSHFLPRNNKCIIRMATISSGVFVAVDASDAAIRTYLSGTRGKKEFITKLLLRTNFTGIGKFLIALKNDIYVNVFNNEWTTIQQPIQIPDSDYTIEDVAIDISVDVDSTGIYEYAFYRMFESVKKTKDDFSKAMSVDKDIQVALLQLEDEETRLYDTTVKMSQHSLIVETEYLLMRLLAFYGIAYTPYTGNERYSYYMPFYRIEDGKKIAYVFTPTITTSLNWEKIKEQYDVDGIKAVAMVELGPDADTRNTIVGYEIQKSDGFIDCITLRDLFSLISDDEYNVYKEFVEKYNTDVHKLIGYRTIVVPSEESLDKLKLNLETELRQLTFAKTMREENLYEGQAQTIECNFWDKGLYKALLGDSTFAESLLSSEWYGYYEAMANILREENGGDLTYFLEYFLELLSRAVDERRLRMTQREEQARQAEQELAKTPLASAPSPPVPSPDDSPHERKAITPQTEHAQAEEVASDLSGFQAVALTETLESGIDRTAQGTPIELLTQYAKDPTKVIGQMSAFLLMRMKAGKMQFTTAELAEAMHIIPRQFSSSIRYMKEQGIIQLERRDSHQKYYKICTEEESKALLNPQAQPVETGGYDQDVLDRVDELVQSNSPKDKRIGGLLLECMARGEITVDDYAAIGESSKWFGDMQLASQLGLVEKTSPQRYVILRHLKTGALSLSKGQKRFITEMYETFGDDVFSTEMVIATLDYSGAHVSAYLHQFTLLRILDCRKEDVYRYQFLINPEEHPEYFEPAA